MSTENSPTAGFAFHHAMIRVKDPEPSLKFYTEVLGMKYVVAIRFEDLFFFTPFFSMYYISVALIRSDSQTTLVLTSHSHRLVQKYDFEKGQFSLYFLTYTDEEVPEDQAEKDKWLWSHRGGIVELTQ